MQNQVIDEIAKHLGVTPQDIDPQATLKEGLGLGPIEMSDLLGALAQKFNVILDPSDLEGLHTVNDIVVLIEDQSLE